MTNRDKLTELMGREPEFMHVTYNGQQGYLPLYFNYKLKNSASELFGNTQEEALEKLLDYLQKNGEQNGIETERTGINSEEDQGA